MLPFEAILFDAIGTTVCERQPDVVTTSFRDAFSTNGVTVHNDLIQQYRGLDKRVAIARILESTGSDLKLSQVIYDNFRSNLVGRVDHFSEHEELPKVVDVLKKSRIRIGVGTGLSSDVFQILFEHLQWHRHSFDFVGVCDDARFSRPHPRMIESMAEKLSVSPASILKVGDTVADIREGKNAGSLTGVVLSGTQPVEALIAEKPTYVFHTLADVCRVVVSC